MSLLPYLVQVNIYLVLFYTFYVVLLRNETFFGLNRLYLISSASLSFLIPAVQLPWIQSLFISKNVQETTAVISLNAAELAYSIPAEDTSWRTIDYLTAIYVAGLVFVLLRFIYRLTLVTRTRRQDRNTAFSFFSLVNVSDAISGRETILKHEEVHVKQLHSADVIFFELVAVVNWFNPVVWNYQKSIRFIHEFIADDVVTKAESKESYAYLLLSNALGVQAQPLTNSFFNESLLKRRIFMLNKTRSAKVGIWKYGLSAPLFMLMLILSSSRMKAESIDEIKESISKIPDVVAANVPAASTGLPSSPQDDFYKRNPTVKKIAYTEKVKGVMIYYKNGKSERLSLETKAQRTAVEKRFGKLPSIFPPPKSVVKSPTPLLTDTTSPASNEISAPTDSIYDVKSVDKMPEYPGGMSNFFEFLRKTYRFPEEAKAKGLKGRVVVSFTVEKDGSLSGLKVLRHLGYGTEEEAIRTLKLSPKWNPALKDGNPVAVKYVLPIQLNTVEGDKTGINIKLKDSDYRTSFILKNGKQITADEMNKLDPKSMKKIEVIKDKAILRERGIDEKYEALILLTTE